MSATTFGLNNESYWRTTYITSNIKRNNVSTKDCHIYTCAVNYNYDVTHHIVSRSCLAGVLAPPSLLLNFLHDNNTAIEPTQSTVDI